MREENTMRKRRLPVIMALALMCCLVMLTGKSVKASEGEKIDGSYLTEGDSSAGKAVLKMRGVYLMTLTFRLRQQGCPNVALVYYDMPL